MSRLTEIPYRPDSTCLFRALRDLPRAVWLDSGHPSDCAGRFDIIAADPGVTLTTRGRETQVATRSGGVASAADPLVLLREALGEPAAIDTRTVRLPFAGGAIGYFAYDLGRRYERVEGTACDDVGSPEMVVGIYDWAVVVDHQERRTWLVGQGRDPSTFVRWDEIVERASCRPAARPDGPFEVLSAVTSNLPQSDYANAFVRIKNHIRLGNCYQVNLTQRFEARVSGDSWQAYLALRAANPAPFSAYLDFPEGQVLSSSPELFLRVVDGHVETKPIKGTRRRSADADEDRRLVEELRNSIKDRAENVMIVDLLRNDFGRVCEAGSIHADRLFEIETFASVHHLVSTVTGTLRSDRHALDLLRACFPGGSITGAPKLAAMRIIDDVEPNWRNVYCGSIGYIGYDGCMDTNIAIRTLLRRDDSIYAWAGGGIVADSELDDEYQESFDKAAAMLSILEPAGPLAAG